MANIFQTVQGRRPKANKFDLSHERKFTFEMGELIPMVVQEVLPGDSFRLQTEVMIRLAPMIAPVMHRVNATVHYYYVPNRIIWDEFEDFITGGPNGTTNPVAPYIKVSAGLVDSAYFTTGSLADYMGIPRIPTSVVPSGTKKISALPFRAYQLIYNEYYRDQNVTSEVTINKGSGEVAAGDDAVLLTRRKRAWEKDYFTSALPWAQRGPEVLIPIEGEGDVTYSPISTLLTQDGDPASANTLAGTGGLITGELVVNKANAAGAGTSGRLENIDSVFLTNATTTINELRKSIKLQEWLEKNARGGARYTEQILSHFGVVSSDARLQRPEYLGGGKTPVIISEVVSTFQASDGEGDPQGNMAGHGIAVGNQNKFTRRFEEHGYIIGLISVQPRTAYSQGLPKHFTRFDRFDYYWPEFANIGEQEVKNQEIYWDPAASDSYNAATFGYQSRYAEYKYQPSTTHSLFNTSLDFWHMGRVFAAPPALNTPFIEADPTTRIFAVEEGGGHLICQLYNKIDAYRLMPYYGTPQL